MQVAPHPSLLRADAPVLQDIRDRAAAADRGEITLDADLAALHRSGLLATVVADTACFGNALRGADILRRIGRASLPVGRIVEGHCNALRLIQLYGGGPQKHAAWAAAARGEIFGVWGAEGPTPVTIAHGTGQRVTLEGAKQFCSGLGLVRFVVLPVRTDAGPQLLLADVQDQSRADPATWQVSGMRATLSGRYDLTGVTADLLGQPGDYLREPHFEGGIWRYCALHCGGLEALTEAVRQHVITRGQQADPHQRHRLAQMVILANTARLWVNAACAAVESGEHVAAAVAQVLLAREAVEQACQAGIALSERSLGTAAFGAGAEGDRIRRDLGFFLRQANLDGKLAMACDHILRDPAPVGEFW